MINSSARAKLLAAGAILLALIVVPAPFLPPLRNGFAVDDFMPPIADLPANLTLEQLRRDYGGVGGPRYRQQIGEIEVRLDRRGALSRKPSGQ